MKKPRKLLLLIFFGLLMAAISACNLQRSSIESGNVAIAVTADQGGTFSWPELGELSIQPGALSADTTVSVTRSTEPPVHFSSMSPFIPAGSEITIDFGMVDQERVFIMRVPIPDEIIENGYTQLVVRTFTPEGKILLVSAVQEDSTISFPVVVPGRYQIYALDKDRIEQLGEGIAEIRDPLTVPLYPQIAPDWCSPTSLTMLAQYHQGAWPAGGTGSIWGETSSWYLTGLAHQPANSGNFFTSLLAAAGYSAPSSVHDSFSTQEMEVIIWNWENTIYTNDTGTHHAGDVDQAAADALYDAFQSYVRSYLWGLSGARRPVAWGSGMIEHSRVLTGSDETILFYNEPGNGTFNQAWTWISHRNQLMMSLTSGKPEIIDTVVIHTEPRSPEERRGVIWLLPEGPFTDSSITLRDSSSGEDICYWYWDGSGTRNGYYFGNESAVPNPCAEMPSDPEFDRSFGIHLRNMELFLRVNIFNIDDENHEYLAAIEVLPNGIGAPIQILHAKTPLIHSHLYKLNALETTFPLDLNLGAGRHVLRFTLWLDGILQDTKYVAFSIPDFTAPLPAMPTPESYYDIPLTTATLFPITIPTYTPTPTEEPTSTECVLHSPLLLDPADGSWTVSTSPELEWDYISFTCWPQSYHIQVATDSRFMTKIVDTVITGNTFQPSRLEKCTKYFWRVAGVIGDQQGPFSASRWFMPGDMRQCP